MNPHLYHSTRWGGRDEESLFTAAELAVKPTFVHFSALYQLRHRAHSLTALHSLAPSRARSAVSLTACDEVANHLSAARSPSVTAMREPADPTPRQPPHSILPSEGKHGEEEPAPPFHFVAPSSMTTPNMRLSSEDEETPAALPLLSTMDMRELSKVIVRDAVFARVLDLVESRQHVQAAVWTLSSDVIQIDGAVALYGARPEMRQTPDSAASNPAAPSCSSDLASRSRVELQEVIRARLEEIAGDAELFACLLQPYLGSKSNQGCVIRAVVDVRA